MAYNATTGTQFEVLPSIQYRHISDGRECCVESSQWGTSAAGNCPLIFTFVSLTLCCSTFSFQASKGKTASKWPKRIAVGVAAACGGASAWAAYIHFYLGRDVDEEVEFRFPKLHAFWTSLTAPEPDPVFSSKAARERKMDPNVVNDLGEIFVKVDSNIREGMTREIATAVLQELGFVHISASALDEAFQCTAPASTAPIPRRARPKPKYERGEMPALGNAELTQDQEKLRPVPVSPEPVDTENVGIDAFIDLVARLRDEAGNSGAPASDEAISKAINASPYLSQLRQPYQAGVNGKVLHHVESWRFMFAGLTNTIAPKGEDQIDLTPIAGKTGIVKETSDESDSTSIASSEQKAPELQVGTGNSLPSIPDLSDEANASEVEMIELELRNVRAALQRDPQGSYKQRLLDQEKELEQELAAELRKQ